MLLLLCCCLAPRPGFEVSLRERVAELANLPRQQVVLLNTLEERLTALENGTVDWSIGSAWVLWV